MKLALCLGVLGLSAACDVSRDRGVPSPETPWVIGLSQVVSTDEGKDGVSERMREWSRADPACVASAYPGFELSADVAPLDGTETVLASYSQGIVVLDHHGHLIAATPGYRCEGSRDEIDLLAAGDAYGARTIVVAATGGGRAESTTWVTLFRVAEHRIDAAFTGAVEVRHGDRVAHGSIVLLPDALIYTRPGDGPQLFVYDSIARAYLAPGEPLEPPHPDDNGPVAER